MSGTRKEGEPLAPEGNKSVDLEKLEAKLARLNREAEQLGEVMKQKRKKN